MTATMKSGPLVGVIAAIFGGLCSANAGMITVSLTVDEFDRATAVLAGSLLDTQASKVQNSSEWPGSGGVKVNSRVSTIAKAGEKWNVWAEVYFFRYYKEPDSATTLASRHDLVVHAQHMLPPPSHIGETRPNPLEMHAWLTNINGADLTGLPELTESTAILQGHYWPHTPFAPRSSDTIPHLAGLHVDVMSVKMVDLNGTEAGVFKDGQLAATIELRHVPEPSTFAILGIGLTGLFAYRRRTTKNCR